MALISRSAFESAKMNSILLLLRRNEAVNGFPFLDLKSLKGPMVSPLRIATISSSDITLPPRIFRMAIFSSSEIYAVGEEKKWFSPIGLKGASGLFSVFSKFFTWLIIRRVVARISSINLSRVSVPLRI